MAAITGVMVAPLIVFIFSLIATCVDHVDKSEEEISFSGIVFIFSSIFLLLLTVVSYFFVRIYDDQRTIIQKL